MLKIECSVKRLLKAVLNVQRAVSTKTTLAVLEGILLKAEDDYLQLCAYNLELGIKTKIDAKVLEEGEIVLTAKIFAEIARKLPSDIVSIQVDENNTTVIKSGRTKFSISGISTEEFPKLPDISENFDLVMPQKILKSMINQTLYAISNNEIKPVYTGSLFEISGNVVKLVSLDGCRLAIRKENVKTSIDEEKKFIVPGKNLKEVVQLIGDNDENIKIILDRKYVVFQNEDYYIVSRLINGVFMEYSNNIPKSEDIKITVKVSTEDFIKALETVSIMVSDNVKNPIRCVFNEEGSINFFTMTSIGMANDEIEADIKGETLEVGFNQRFLLDALRNIDTDKVKLEIKSETSPLKITPIEGDEFLALVLPVRLS